MLTIPTMPTMRALHRGKRSLAEMPMETAATSTESAVFDKETVMMSEEELNDGRRRRSNISFERHVHAVWKEMLALVDDDKDNDDASIEISSSSSFRLSLNDLIPGHRDSSNASLTPSSASTITSSSSSSIHRSGRRRSSVLGCIQDEIIRKGIAEGKLVVGDDGNGSIANGASDNEENDSEYEEKIRSNGSGEGGSRDADASASAISSAAASAARLRSSHPSHDAQHQHCPISFARGASSLSLTPPRVPKGTRLSKTECGTRVGVEELMNENFDRSDDGGVFVAIYKANDNLSYKADANFVIEVQTRNMGTSISLYLRLFHQHHHPMHAAAGIREGLR